MRDPGAFEKSRSKLIDLYNRFYSPAVYHDAVDNLRATRWWGKTKACFYMFIKKGKQTVFHRNSTAITSTVNLSISHALKRFVSKTPYLIEETAIAPHITSCGVLAIVNSLWSCPFYRNLLSLGHIVVILNKIPSHAKVTDLQ